MVTRKKKVTKKKIANGANGRGRMVMNFEQKLCCARLLLDRYLDWKGNALWQIRDGIVDARPELEEFLEGNKMYNLHSIIQAVEGCWNLDYNVPTRLPNRAELEAEIQRLRNMVAAAAK